MAEHDAKRDEEREEQPRSRELGGQPTTGGSMPGGAATGLRHESGITSGGAAGPLLGGAPPVGAIGGSGTGAGGLATGPGGIGGTRNLVHGAGIPTYGPAGPAPHVGGDVALPTGDTAETVHDHVGALGGEASSRTGNAGVEPSQGETTVRGSGLGGGR